MIDFGNLYCHIHPNEIITNFCLSNQCIIGLCATCICTHTQNHINNKTSPEYQNIRDTYSSMHELIRQNISSLDKQKNRIEKLCEFIHTKKIAVKQNIQQVKKQTIQALNIFFQNKQKSLLREIDMQQKKFGLHSELRLQSLINSLTRQTSSLISSAQQINSNNFLESYKRIKLQILMNSSNLVNEISHQLDMNQSFQTIINSTNDHIEKINKILDQSITLNFKLNSQEIVQNNKNNNQITEKPRQQFIKSNQSTVTSKFMNQKSQNKLRNHEKTKSMPNNNLQTYQQNTAMMTFNTQKINSLQQTKQFTNVEKQNSIYFPIKKKQKSLQRKVSNKNLKFDLVQQNLRLSTPIQSVCSSKLFKQKDTNRLNERSQKSTNLFNNVKNCQSQIIISQKPQNVIIKKQKEYQQGINSNGQTQNNFNYRPPQKIIVSPPPQMLNKTFRPQLSKSQPKVIINNQNNNMSPMKLINSTHQFNPINQFNSGNQFNQGNQFNSVNQFNRVNQFNSGNQFNSENQLKRANPVIPTNSGIKYQQFLTSSPPSPYLQNFSNFYNNEIKMNEPIFGNYSMNNECKKVKRSGLSVLKNGQSIKQ